MRRMILVGALLCVSVQCFSWGFYGHKLVNYHAIFLLPPELVAFYKPSVLYITEHAVDPDKRRYAVVQEGPRHYIDMDRYGVYPFDSLPRTWKAAVGKYSEDSLAAHGIVPWWIQTMMYRLTAAFKEKDRSRILKLSAELGHYTGDAHVPLHTSSNHNGQHTGQRGIHGFWESRLPELFAEKEWDFCAGKATYIKNPLEFTWKIILESARAADSVLLLERRLNERYPSDAKYAFENRNGQVIKQYSTAYSRDYDRLMKGMVERRMRESIAATASLWYTAWVNAGQPDCTRLVSGANNEQDAKELEEINNKWKEGIVKGKSCD